MVKIPIYKPFIPEETFAYMNDVLNSGWISSFGEYNEKVIKFLKEKFGYKYVLLTSSGTAANHLMIECLKREYPESKTIIVPNNVYVAAWNPILYSKYHSMYYLDADIDTWNIQLRQSINDGHKYIFLAVHNLGNPVDIPWIKEAYSDLIIIEDNCEGFGGKYREKYTGTESIMSSLSFYTNKIVTSGEGGAFITNDRNIYELAKHLHGQGQHYEIKYYHDILGYNYRMTNVHAAILYAQLQHYDEIKEKKKFVYDYYINEIDFHLGATDQVVEMHCEHSQWMFAMRIYGNPCYETVQGFFDTCGIETRPMFYPINVHMHLRDVNGNSTNNAKILSKECFMLPSYPDLTEEKLEYIVKIVNLYISKLKGLA